VRLLNSRLMPRRHCEDGGAEFPAAENAHRKNNFVRRVAFVGVHAALHGRHGDATPLPMTRRPAWPMAVERGKPGILA